MINLIEKSTAPLFQQMKEQIFDIIKKSGLRPGDKIPSENQFCLTSDVSIRTVRRALAELEKEGVIVRRQGKGSFLRDLNAASKPFSAGVIGVLFSDMQYLSNSIFSRLLQSVEAHVIEHSYSFHLYSMGNRLSEQCQPLEQIVPLHEVKGLLATSALNRDDITTLRRNKTALVTFNEYRDMQLNSVVFDFYSAARLGIEYLWSCGYEEIAFICRRFSASNSFVILNNDNFLRGIRDTYSSSGKKLDETMIFQSDAQREDGRRIADALLKSTKRPDAIFTTGELLAQGVMASVAENNLRIPENIGLLACAGTAELRGIPSIEIPVADWSNAAVNLLMKAINGDTAIRKSKVLTPRLSVINGCGKESPIQ